MKTQTLLKAAGVALLSIIGAASTPTAQATFSGHNGKIAYTDSTGRSDIAVINPDGTGFQLLTSGEPEIDVDPAWSPDGRRIVFASNRGRSSGVPWDLWIMNADGSAPARIATPPLCCPHDPTWSPDGSRLAFRESDDIYVVNVDGTGLTRLTFDSTQEWDPAWSPDGSRIAYQGNRTGRFDIYVINPDGSGEVNLTNTPTLHDQSPSWSPDGSRIAYDSGPLGSEVFSIPSDGTGVPTQLSNGTNSYDPAWSPDGTKIAFGSTRDQGANEIYVMNADGTDESRITFDGGFRSDFDWQPLVEPQLSDFKNASDYCKGLREFLGDAEFSARYRNHGSCVSANAPR